MALEIERKFLVSSDVDIESLGTAVRITQGYLTQDPQRTVRVRIMGDHAYLTIKGASNNSGTTRYEWEKEIEIEEANELLKLCVPTIIDKTRTRVIVGEHTFEVDCFLAENAGLILAEVELGSEDEVFERPDWLGKEVTGDSRYYNSQLSKNPYRQWSET